MEGGKYRTAGGIHAGHRQYSVDRMNEELDRVKALQIPAILIFGIPEP